MTTVSQYITNAFHDSRVLDQIELPETLELKNGIRFLNQIININNIDGKYYAYPEAFSFKSSNIVNLDGFVEILSLSWDIGNVRINLPRKDIKNYYDEATLINQSGIVPTFSYALFTAEGIDLQVYMGGDGDYTIEGVGIKRVIQIDESSLNDDITKYFNVSYGELFRVLLERKLMRVYGTNMSIEERSDFNSELIDVKRRLLNIKTNDLDIDKNLYSGRDVISDIAYAGVVSINAGITSRGLR